METISIRDLHMHTGKWVRQVEKSTGQVVISDRGRPIARLMPLDEQKRRAFSDRILAEGFEDLPPVEVDSTHILEEDRR
jgi:prevent-host-death family protein